MISSKVFVLVPSYNEDEILRATISSFQKNTYQIVVIDDGSEKNQISYLNDLPVHFLKHPFNLGQGAALQTGTNYALQNEADFIVHFDADGQHSSHDVEKILAPLFSGKWDVTLGSRFLQRNNKQPHFFKKFLLHSARYLNCIFTGILLTDAHNGFRAMNKAAAQKMIIRENRMAHASEILFLLKKNNLRFKEVPVTIDYTPYSRQKGQSSWNSVRILFDLLLHKLFE